MAEMDQTIWRGLQIAHPGDWELSVASGPDQPLQCVFSDRLYQRLDVRWRPLKYVPQMDRMLEAYRKKEDRDEKVHLSDLSDAPEGWQGVVRKTEGSAIVRAGRFCRAERLLIEATIIWPGRRDIDVENAVLSGTSPYEDDGDGRRWEAMGIRMTAPKAYDLMGMDVKVGKVTWRFGDNPRREPNLIIERIAMPDYWLKEPLREWLSDELPSPFKIHRQERVNVRNHTAEQLFSHAKIGIVAALRGLRRVRLDRAWLCPVENRVYHVAYTTGTKTDEIALPEPLEINCRP